MPIDPDSKLVPKRWIAEIRIARAAYAVIEFSESSFLRAYWHAEEKGEVVRLERKWVRNEKFAHWEALT